MSGPQGMWGLTFSRFRRSKLATAALLYVVFVTVVAAIAPLIAGERAIVPFDPNATDLTHRLEPPDSRHHLGTDDLGRDLLSRMVHGARISLAIGLTATLI